MLDDDAGDNWGLTSESVGVFLFTILSGFRRVGGTSAFLYFLFILVFSVSVLRVWVWFIGLILVIYCFVFWFYLCF